MNHSKSIQYSIKKIAVYVLGILCLSCSGNKSNQDKEQDVESKKQPNLLIIQTDEHNFRTLGCYRETLSKEQAFIWGENNAVETPNIDWLADNGALCTSFYASTPVCSPSRGSLMSGRYPQNTPVITNDIPLSDNIVTFAEVLSKNGYATGYAGKWHLDGLGKPQWAPMRKFGFEDNRYMFNRGHWKQLEDTPEGPRVAAFNKKGEPSYGIEGANAKNFTTDFLSQKTIDFITDHKNERFCYMLSLPDPHGPDQVRAPYDTMFNHFDFAIPSTFEKDTTGLPSWAAHADKKMSQQAMSRYFGMVKCIDDNIGKIIETLKNNGQLDNTIVVFTSDHGDLCGEHGRTNKGVPMEGSAKIPFVLYYPSAVKAKSLIHQALTTVDFMPTILGLIGVEKSGQEEGRDASDLFRQKSTDWKDVAFIRGTGQKDQKSDVNWFGALTDRYKLIYAPEDEPWLIDLEKDPDELTNFYNDLEYQNTIKELAIELLNYGKTSGDPRIKIESIKKQMDEVMQ